MDDVGFMALAESAISYVDGRYGRPFAWALAFGVTLLAIGAAASLLLGSDCF